MRGLRNYEKVGREAFDLFNQKITNESFDERRKEKLLNVASDLVKETPFVLLPFKEVGLWTSNKDASLLTVFRPNLWLQDYAFEVNALSNVTISTTTERASAVFEYIKHRHSFIRDLLIRKGRNFKDFYTALENAALIESAYYTRIGGDDLDESNAKKIDIALMKRALKNEPVLDSIAKKQGVNKDDPAAMIDLVKDLDLTACLQEISKKDPYFNRRQAQINTFNKINSEESIKLPGINNDSFVLELLRRLLKKGKVDSWLIKEVEKHFNKPLDFEYDKNPVS